MSEPLDIAVFRAWISREDHGSDLVTPELAKRFSATLDHPMSERIGTLAPLGIHWCLAPPTLPTSTLGPDGHPERGGFLPPIPLPRRMWAGGSLALKQPLHVGDLVQRRSRIGDVILKQGRTGPLCFVTVQHEYKVDDRVVLAEDQEIVYRGLENHGPPPRSKPVSDDAPEARWTRTVDAEPTLLFRYSALTFNGHRIHYDRRYCNEQEGYPGLVVHGPLQATLLLRFAAEIRGGEAVHHFAFRSVAPLFDGATFHLNAVETGDGLQLWTADHTGRKAMTAQATW